jgi:Flp pilus assembly protein TadB
MSEGVVTAIITGVFTLIGTIITVIVGLSKANKNIEIVQAVTNTKLDNLTAEVKRHNNFAERLPAIEANIDNMDRRIENLEQRVG